MPPSKQIPQVVELCEYIHASQFVLKPVIINGVCKSKLLILLTPSFAKCQTFGLWKTTGLYAGMNGSYYYLNRKSCFTLS